MILEFDAKAQRRKGIEDRGVIIARFGLMSIRPSGYWRLLADLWIPAFAGMTKGNAGMTRETRE